MRLKKQFALEKATAQTTGSFIRSSAKPPLASLLAFWLMKGNSTHFFHAMLLVYSDDFRVIRTTADPGTIHNQNKWTLLHVAAAFNHLQCAKLLLKSGGRACLRKSSHNGSTPLHLAALSGEYKQIPSPLLLPTRLQHLKAKWPFAHFFLQGIWKCATC